jgi:hypothetical protein
MSPLTWFGFGQHMSRYILLPHGHRRPLVDIVEMNFVSSLVWNGYFQQRLRYILCPR